MMSVAPITEQELHAYLDGPDFFLRGRRNPGKAVFQRKLMAVGLRNPVAAGGCGSTDSCGGGRCWLVRS
jgi:hypothetical protein